MSGVIVDRRDQVLITGGRWPPDRARSTAFVMPLSMNGPFLTERAMILHFGFAISDCGFLSPNSPSGSLRAAAPHKIRNPKSEIRNSYLVLRSFKIIFCVRLLLRVLYPRVGWPQGVTGFRPPEVLPSPPPCGWSTGFIATPRTFGRSPFQRDLPALPNETFSCSMFPTWPTVALQTKGTRRTSPEGMRNCAYSPSFATNCANVPAERAIWPPLPGRNSML